MTDKQKEAVKLLNEIRYAGESRPLNDDEYFLLMDFVVNNEQQISGIPFQPNTPLTYPQVTYETT